MLDGSPAPTNKNGVPIAPGIRATTYWRGDAVTVAGKGAGYDGRITMVTKDDEGKDVCEVSYHAQNGEDRFAWEHKFDELHPTNDGKTEDIIYDPDMPMTLLPLLFTCSDCVDANHQIDDSCDLVSNLCRRCMCTAKLGNLSFCAECGDCAKCIGFNHPESGNRVFFCTGKEGRTDGVELDSSNISSNDYAVCTKCEAERIRLSQAKARRAKGSRANNMGRDVVFWWKCWSLLDENEELRSSRGSIRWKKLAPLLDDEVKTLMSAYRTNWVDTRRRKECGECARCKRSDPCVVDLKSFEAFMRKRPNEKFGADAQTGRPAILRVLNR